MRISRCLILVGLLLLTTSGAFAQPCDPPRPNRAETWIGWAWLGEAGDLPLRVHLSDSEDGPEGLLDSPAHRAYGMTLEAVGWNESVIRLQGTSRTGSRISIEGTACGDRIEGTIAWADYSGTVELIRSPHRLPFVSPENYADAAGFYERAPGDLVELRPRPWGELVYRELRTGRVRTLLPLDGDRFFIGGGIYLPDPVEAEIRLHRDEAGSVRALTEIRPDGVEVTAARIALVEEALRFESAGETLSGFVLRRPDLRRAPGIVLLGGSSWETRDDVAFHARSLAILGFAVLSFDRRGYGESQGSPIVPFATTAADAVAAVEALRKRDDVDRDRVGLFGMSRGGWQAPLAATMSDEVGFLILLVPPAVSPADQETRSRLDQMRQDGFSRDAIDLASRLLEATWRWIREEDGWDEYARLRAEAVVAGLPEYVLERDSPEPERWAWARLNMFFDPCPFLGKVDVPTLAIFAENDIYVSAGISRARLEECFGEREHLTVHTIAGAGHDLAISNELPIHRQSGRGDEGFSVLADWSIDTIFGADADPCH